jgi:hypothetical protein
MLTNINTYVKQEAVKVFNLGNEDKAISDTTYRITHALDKYFAYPDNHVLSEVSLIQLIQVAVDMEDPTDANALMVHIYYKAITKYYLVGSNFTRIDDKYVYHPNLTKLIYLILTLVGITALVLAINYYL